MTDDLETAVEEFLDGADVVLTEYENGYADADAALGMLEDRIDDLRDAVEG